MIVTTRRVHGIFQPRSLDSDWGDLCGSALTVSKLIHGTTYYGSQLVKTRWYGWMTIEEVNLERPPWAE